MKNRVIQINDSFVTPIFVSTAFVWDDFRHAKTPIRIRTYCRCEVLGLPFARDVLERLMHEDFWSGEFIGDLFELGEQFLDPRLGSCFLDPRPTEDSG